MYGDRETERQRDRRIERQYKDNLKEASTSSSFGGEPSFDVTERQRDSETDNDEETAG